MSRDTPQAQIERWRTNSLDGCTCRPKRLPMNREQKRLVKKRPEEAVWFWSHQPNCALGRCIEETRLAEVPSGTDW